MKIYAAQKENNNVVIPYGQLSWVVVSWWWIGLTLKQLGNFYPSAQIGLEGYCRHPAGGRAGVTTAPLPLSRAQLLSDRSQTW